MSIHEKHHRWQSLISLGLFMSLLIIFLGHSQKAVSQGLMPTTALSQIQTQQQMVVAANPLASQAGLAVLRQGGNAIDAAIAVQGVLNLVEPQSSGIGGGGFLVYYNAAQKRVMTYDGRETAPAAARGDRFLDAAGKPLAFYDAVVGGKSVGTPGLLKMLDLAHREQGKLPWKDLWQPAIALANQGFPISPRLYSLLEKDRFLKQNPAALNYFYQSTGEPKPVFLSRFSSGRTSPDGDSSGR
jgi:gamma-glutamyltranspeptidase / glutathione hydrolase